MARKRSASLMEDMVLVPLDRRRRRRVRVYGSLFVILVIIAAFIAGQITARENTSRLERDRSRLTDQVRVLDSALQSARNELALHRTGTEVSQQAQEQVRSEIRDLRGQLAELEEAVAFYKNVMAPGSVEQGLRIEKFDLAPAATAGEFAFRLVLTQVGDNRNNVAGDVLLKLSGMQAEEQVQLSGSDILVEGSETRFRFRYFQELTGRLRLPEGLQPEQITVEAINGARRNQKTEKTYMWQLQERSGAWAG
ncbi:DUF6776 family protein [Alcanivorax sp. 1008]|uniref:DUF6776 family protein n=1 Tax=Alcanivorax sp. 1008 TaxID=2816853 RepID=UPI001D392D13|nr:DUF6776 family protein [Alcanivorax sp. 1008]MCC1497860.1 hypothetical protein [Alcanivorax sp. 1008]